MTAYSGSRPQSAGTDFTYRPRPQSCATTYVTDARHSPGSGHQSQPSWNPGTHTPSWRTKTALGGSMRLTSPDTALTLGGQR